MVVTAAFCFHPVIFFDVFFQIFVDETLDIFGFQGGDRIQIESVQLCGPVVETPLGRNKFLGVSFGFEYDFERVWMLRCASLMIY